MLRLSALAGLAVTLFSAVAAPVQAQAQAQTQAQAEDATLYTVTYVEVGPVLSKVGAASLQAYRDAARRDAVSLDVLERIDRPNQFVMLAAWADPKAVEGHSAGDAAKKLNEKLSTMLASPNDTRQHHGLSIAPAKAGRDAVFAVTHIDVIPAEKDSAANALEQLADSSRRHAGNLQFDVWRQVQRPNHFTLVEAWANRGAFDVHGMQRETREFRMRLAPMLGALYDERLYKVLK
jgi:quinol monooxygenase YgiN